VLSRPPIDRSLRHSGTAELRITVVVPVIAKGRLASNAQQTFAADNDDDRRCPLQGFHVAH